MNGCTKVWPLLASCLWIANLACGQAPAVVATDVPITVGETMQNDASLADVTFVDAATGWAVGDRGVIWHTADAGKTWQLQASGVAANLSSVYFLDRAHGWAAGGETQPYSDASRAVLLATDDGGATWREIEQATLPAIIRLKFFDARRGIAAGESNALYPSGVFTTRDGGKTWLPLPSDSNGRWLAADFPDADLGAVAGPAGRFATLMQRHVVNSPAAVASSRAYRALRLAPPTEGWLVGDGGLVMSTHDLGNSWQTPPGPLPDFAAENFDFQALATAGSLVWVAGSPGTRVFHSADGGHTWQPSSTGQTAPLRAITFIDERAGFAVGDLGTILATNDGGRTWQIQRRGGERAALLLALASDGDIPLELVGKLGAEEGYLTTVSLLRSDARGSEVRARDALLLAGATASSLAWQFSLPNDEGLSPDDLLVLINRANDGRGVERLERYFVRQLRTWRPDVVVTHFIAEPGAHPLESIVQRMVDQSLRAAADPNQYVDLASNVGLDPWAVKKFYGVLPTGWRGEERITTGQFAPRLGTTLADWAEPSRRLLRGMPTAAPDAIDLQLIAVGEGVPTHESHDVFAGIRLAPGSDARRRLANLPGEDIEKLRRLATRRRQMRMLVEQSQGNAAWASQVSHLTDDLDPESAGELLFELAEGYRAAGKLDLAADTYSSLARSRPEHPAVEPALRWLVQFYASGETARRLESRDAQNYRASPTPEVTANAVQQASAVAPINVGTAPVTGLSRDNRLERAKTLGAYLESARPSLYADASVRFPLVVAERKLGFSNPAQRYFLTLKSLPENDPWRSCAQTEEWFAHPGESPPPKQLGNCRRAAERPHLDGKLDESLWKSADRLLLKNDSLKRGQNDLPPAAVRFACDGQYLYLAIECPKSQGVEYAPDDRPRPRDADLSAHDRVTIQLDVDRDYTTAYELAIDCRGWTSDACWNDATWNPQWFVATAADDSTWTAEAAIPLAELVDEPPTSRQVWAVSLVRTIPQVGDESWSADATSADSPDRFGLLIFE